MTPNSRSYLNHFTQPDSIVPDPYNSQDYDRYSYARNNPLRYTDPTGHVTEKALYYEGDGPLALASYGVFVEDRLSSATLLAISKEVREIAKALGEANEKDAVTSFQEKFSGNVGIESWSSDQCECAADVRFDQDDKRWEIRIFDPNWATGHSKLFVHEFGHIYYNLHSEEMNPMTYPLRRPTYGDKDNGYYGFGGRKYEWQFAVTYIEYDNEIFADMFLGWVYDKWNYTSNRGQARKLYMDVNMSGIVSGGSYER